MSISDFGKLYEQTVQYVLAMPKSEKEIRDYLKRKQLRRRLMQKRYDEFVSKMKNDPEYRDQVKELRKKVREKNEKLREKDFTEDNRTEYIGAYKTGLPTKPGAEILDTDIERVVVKLREQKLINDSDFAEVYVGSRKTYSGISERKLKLELRRKGVSEEIAEKALSENEWGEKPRDDKIEIQKILSRKLPKLQQKIEIRREALAADNSLSESEREKDLREFERAEKQKLMSYLVRNGFEYDLVKEVIK